MLNKGLYLGQKCENDPIEKIFNGWHNGSMLIAHTFDAWPTWWLGFSPLVITNITIHAHSEGEEWQEVRSLLGKHMLRPKAVEVYDETLNSVVSDLISKLRFCRSSQGLVTDITREFYRFGLEGKAPRRLRRTSMKTNLDNQNSLSLPRMALKLKYFLQDPKKVAVMQLIIFFMSSIVFFFSPGISSVLFESRIGCLDPIIPEETERFIESIKTMFVMTLFTMAMPSWLHRLYPKPWKTFCDCWDYIFEFGRRSKPSHQPEEHILNISLKRSARKEAWTDSWGYFKEGSRWAPAWRATCKHKRINKYSDLPLVVEDLHRTYEKLRHQTCLK